MAYVNPTSGTSSEPAFNPISVVVCTLNEAKNLERLWRSISWADEIVVIDCGSEDGTPEIAANLGALVISEPWRGFSAQKNYGASRASNDWILSLDADEILDLDLERAVCAVAADEMNPQNGYVVDRRGEFLGQLLPNSSRRDKRRRFVRLYNRQFSAWDEAADLHEEVKVPGLLIRLPGKLVHSNNSTFTEAVQRGIRYAFLEAQDAHQRQVKPAVMLLAVRPIARFLWLYIFRGEFRLGRTGLVHSAMKAAFEIVRYSELCNLYMSEEASLRERAK